MIRPRALRCGDRIGICAPAGPVKEEKLHAALRALEDDGFEVETAPSVFGRDGLFSAPDDVRCRELEAMFARPDIAAVFCARGGVGSGRLLARVNSAALAASRKPFLGFSDVTVLQWLLWHRHRFVTFSGPLAVEWAGGVSERSRKQAWKMLCGNAPADLLTDFPCDRVRVLRAGPAVSGPLLPGNLTMITTLLGTPFLPDLQGVLLLIEDINEPPHRVDRMLFHLRNAGVLEQIGALLCGELAATETDENTVLRSLQDATRGYRFPVILNLPYGHGPERMTLPVGTRVMVECDPIALRMCEPAVTPREP